MPSRIQRTSDGSGWRSSNTRGLPSAIGVTIRLVRSPVLARYAMRSLDGDQTWLSTSPPEGTIERSTPDIRSSNQSLVDPSRSEMKDTHWRSGETLGLVSLL